MKNFDFSDFYRRYDKYFGDTQILPSSEFLSWFIGFIEGDGSIYVVKGRVFLSISQNIRNLSLLYEIKKVLGMGEVYLSSRTTNTYEYRVQNIGDIYVLFNLLNGNIIFPHKYEQFMNKLIRFNSKLIGKNLTPITPKKGGKIPSLDNAWFSGLTDAEGCFFCVLNIYKLIRNFGFSLFQKYDINKPVLIEFISLFLTGNVYKQGKGWVFKAQNIKILEKGLIPYFNKYPLKGLKSKSYKIWLEILKSIKTKDHRDPDKILIMQKQIENMNKHYKKIGKNS